eukprot:15346615-Ditylum_brightwellii.AAC.1
MGRDVKEQTFLMLPATFQKMTQAQHTSKLAWVKADHDQCCSATTATHTNFPPGSKTPSI